MFEGFDDWDHVLSEFKVKDRTFLPEAVLMAIYDMPAYEGYAVVVYYDQGKYWYVTGSHCSCYGLENQWEPEAYTLDEIKTCLVQHWNFKGYAPKLAALIEQNELRVRTP